MRKIARLILASVALLMTQSVLAEKEVTIDGLNYSLLPNNEAMVSSYQSSDLTVAEIPASITVDGLSFSVTSIGAFAFAGNQNLKSVTIPESVTSIGVWAFNYCNSLPVVDSVRYAGNYLAGVTDQSLTTYKIKEGTKWIGDYAFQGCENMTSITIPESVEHFGLFSFVGCTSLPVVDDIRYAGTYAIEVVDKDKTSYTVKNGTKWLGTYLFENCANMSSITIPNSVIYICDYAFNGCNSLPTISIPEGVKYIGMNAFAHCSNLASVTIPESIISIDEYAFAYCYNLSSITIPENIVSLSLNAFNGCVSLPVSDGIYYAGPFLVGATDQFQYSFTIKAGTKWIGDNAFSNCFAIRSITIPESVISIGEYAFDGCSELTSIVIPDNVQEIGIGAFRNCYKLSTVNLSNGLTGINSSTFGQCTSLESIVIPEGVTYIGEHAFSGCNNLKSINIDDFKGYIDETAFYGCMSLPATDGVIYVGKTVIGVSDKTMSSYTIKDGVTTIADNAFSDCVNLISINIPESVTKIGYSAFRGCTNLKTIVIPEGVKEIAVYTFYNCTGLKSVSLPDNLTTIGAQAFYNCNSLTAINIPNTANIAEDSFTGCNNLPVEDGIVYIGSKLISVADKTLPSYSIKEGTKTISSKAFSDCGNMTSIDIPQSVTIIGNEAFSNCFSLETITIPDGVLMIQESTFSNCISLKSIELPDSMTAIYFRAFENCISLDTICISRGVMTINDYAFSGCSNLVSVTFPESLYGIGSYAFYNCSSLALVYLPKNMSYVNYNAFGNCSEQLKVYNYSNNSFGIYHYEFDKCFDEGDFIYCLADGKKTLCGFKGNLDDFHVPEDVTSIAAHAFNNNPIRKPVVITSTDKIECGFDAFDITTFYHTLLCVPAGLYDQYAYDNKNNWYKFLHIKEYANTPEQVSSRQAYMLMDTDRDSYTVYDGVNNIVATMKANTSVDESNPNNSWMMVSLAGKDYLYNIGAGKFGTVVGGELKLTNNATFINARHGDKGISLEGLSSELYFIGNDNVAAKDGLDAFITEVEKKVAESVKPVQQYDIEGREITSPVKGLNILKYDDGSVSKVLR